MFSRTLFVEDPLSGGFFNDLNSFGSLQCSCYVHVVAVIFIASSDSGLRCRSARSMHWAWTMSISMRAIDHGRLVELS